MFNASDLFSLIVSGEDHSCELLLPLAETPDTTLKTIVQPVYKIDCFPRKLELSTPKLFSAMPRRLSLICTTWKACKQANIISAKRTTVTAPAGKYEAISYASMRETRKGKFFVSWMRTLSQNKQNI